MSDNERKMSMELTKEQFLSLLKAVYLGNWLANAHRDGGPEDAREAEYSEIEHLVFSFAERFGFGRYAENEATERGEFYPTRAFEDETGVDELIAEYDEETFWDELPERLGLRDFHRRYSEEEIERMSGDERFERIGECVGAWLDEIDENGIMRLERDRPKA